MRSPPHAVLLLLLLIIGSICQAAQGASVAAASDLEFDDYGDEDLALSVEEPLVQKGKPFVAPSTPSQAAPQNATAARQWRRRPFNVMEYPLELAALAGLLLFVVNIIRGSQDNKKIAVEFTKATCHNDGIIVRNFSFIGPGGDTPALITKESASRFVLYASGRRFCQSMSLTLNLIKRQDFIYTLAQLVTPQDDELEVEVQMTESTMPQLVLAIAAPKLARSLQKEGSPQPEVAGLTHKMEVGRDRLPHWPSEHLTVLAEHSAQFYDLMPPQLADQVFGKDAFGSSSAWFRSLIVSSEQRGEGQHPCVIKARFALPPRHDEAALSSMLGLVMAFVDLVGTYRLGPDQKKRAEKARQEWASLKAKTEAKEGGTTVQDELRAAKAAQEEDKLKKMTPEARQKYTDRKQKIQQQRSMSRMVRRK